MAVGENNLRKITQLYEHIKVHRKGLPRRLHTSGFVRVIHAQGHFRMSHSFDRKLFYALLDLCVSLVCRETCVLAFGRQLLGSLQVSVFFFLRTKRGYAV
jgi:hypothetical protein